jgi:membrane-associated protease RseP (regulator of RpoE activity)
MSSRKSPSGPQSFISGFITVGDTSVGSSSAQATFSAIAKIAVSPAGTAFANMNGKLMSTNDVVSVSPRVVPMSTTSGSPVVIAFARVLSVEASTLSTAVGIIQIGLQTVNITASAVAVSNTYDITVALRGADL